MADGHLGKCKDCTRRDVGENRLNRRVQYVAYDKARYVGDRRQRREITARRWAHDHQDAVKTHRLVSLAVAAGTLVQLPCRFCAALKSVAHHEDYTKPLDVWWVCQACHFSIHAAKRGLTPWRLLALGAA